MVEVKAINESQSLFHQVNDSNEGYIPPDKKRMSQVTIPFSSGQ